MAKIKTEIKIKKIKDPDTRVNVNCGWHRIEEIKNEIAAINGQRELCKAEVVEMWSDPSETDQ